MSSRFKIQGYPVFNKRRGTRGKGRKINYREREMPEKTLKQEILETTQDFITENGDIDLTVFQTLYDNFASIEEDDPFWYDGGLDKFLADLKALTAKKIKERNHWLGL